MKKETKNAPYGAYSGLTDVEIAVLKSANLPNAEIVKLIQDRRTGVKLKRDRGYCHLIQKHADEMLEQASGKILFTGRTIGQWLAGRGLSKSLGNYAPVGDACGHHGLRLPHADISRVLFYDLTFIRATPEQKEERSSQLNLLGVDVIRRLIAEFDPNKNRKA